MRGNQFTSDEVRIVENALANYSDQKPTELAKLLLSSLPGRTFYAIYSRVRRMKSSRNQAFVESTVASA